MKLSVMKITGASAISFAILWIICSAMVMLMPDFMKQITAHMVHIDVADISWSLSWAGVLLGLAAWIIVAGVTAGFIAVAYNWLDDSSSM